METQDREELKKAVTLYQARNPGVEILDWEPDKNDYNVVYVIASGRKARLSYDRENHEIIILDETMYAPDAKHPEETSKRKRSIPGFLAMVLTTAYAIYLLDYFSDVGVDTLSGYLAVSVVSNHMFCVIVAACFSLVGFFGRKRWAMLTCGVLMAVSIAMFPAYLQMAIVQTILFFIAYARMKV